MLVPFGELQQQVLLAVPAELRVVIYRRLMLRIAERLARKWRARALVTGEVVGQVASQTLENLTTIAEATTLEVLRPLVGMDKDEITAEAGANRHAADLEHSGPGLLSPVHAAAPGHARRRRQIVAAEAALPIDDMVDRGRRPQRSWRTSDSRC